jgi:hypothetical protein
MPDSRTEVKVLSGCGENCDETGYRSTETVSAVVL